MEFGEKIKKLRLQQGLTLEQVGERVGVGKSTVRKWESGQIANMRRDKIASLAKALSVTPQYLMGWTDEELIGDNGNGHTKSEDSRFPIRVPVYGTIPAGIPLEATEDILDYEEIPASMARGNKEYFALKLRGDSMAPEYLDGDVVILRLTSTCNSGDDCAVMINGGESTFKRVRLSPTGMALMPINPAYEPLFFTRQQIEDLPVRILGVVVELRRTKNRR